MRVWNDDHAVGELPDGCISPRDVHNKALFAAIQADEISGLHLARCNDLQTREEIAQRILQRERDRETADPKSRIGVIEMPRVCIVTRAPTM